MSTIRHGLSVLFWYNGLSRSFNRCLPAQYFVPSYGYSPVTCQHFGDAFVHLILHLFVRQSTERLTLPSLPQRDSQYSDMRFSYLTDKTVRKTLVAYLFLAKSAVDFASESYDTLIIV